MHDITGRHPNCRRAHRNADTQQWTIHWRHVDTIQSPDACIGAQRRGNAEHTPRSTASTRRGRQAPHT
ncbi:hypothetical protein [Xanthomonas campestris]|uniref:hypothetical protein n=1 Tax=Xanthomonas campestris TaxID=339 RepID=UPI002359F48F|nr:hypothetical protein [Xanthomonas campestris]